MNRIPKAQLTLPPPVAEEEAPHGFLLRGTYDVLSKFMDDDKKEHLSFKWTIVIKKSWE